MEKLIICLIFIELSECLMYLKIDLNWNLDKVFFTGN